MFIMDIPRDKMKPLNKEHVHFICIHHTACETATPMQIHQWHLDRGWLGFGYNAYIRKDGTVHIGRGFHVGAHTKGYNSQSYGICVEGNYSEEKHMPRPQMAALKRYIEAIKSELPNVKDVVGHNMLSTTECPGLYFPWTELRNGENPHWADGVYEELTDRFGLTIHEKRFDDKITRGEAMALILQGLKALKYYIDQH